MNRNRYHRDRTQHKRSEPGCGCGGRLGLALLFLFLMFVQYLMLSTIDTRIVGCVKCTVVDNEGHPVSLSESDITARDHAGRKVFAVIAGPGEFVIPEIIGREARQLVPGSSSYITTIKVHPAGFHALEFEDRLWDAEMVPEFDVIQTYYKITLYPESSDQESTCEWIVKKP